MELINGCCDKHRNRSVAAYPAFSCHSCASSLFFWPYHTPWQPLKYLLPSGISANHLLKCQDTLEAAVSEKICSGSHICCDEDYYIRESFPPAGGSTLCHTLKRELNDDSDGQVGSLVKNFQYCLEQEHSLQTCWLRDITAAA